MGYTRYWKPTGKEFNKEFVDLNQAIVAVAKSKYGIVIRNGFGDDKPTINMEKIWLNGDGSNGLDHETYCLISGKASDFDFCKTAEKPYDLVVNAMLRIAQEYGYVKDVSDDGENLNIEAEHLVAEAKNLIH